MYMRSGRWKYPPSTWSRKLSFYWVSFLQKTYHHLMNEIFHHQCPRLWAQCYGIWRTTVDETIKVMQACHFIQWKIWPFNLQIKQCYQILMHFSRCHSPMKIMISKPNPFLVESLWSSPTCYVQHGCVRSSICPSLWVDIKPRKGNGYL